MGYGRTDESQPWKVSDAPARYIELMANVIIGIEVKINSIAGRFKMSQEKGKGDRSGVIEGFQNLGTCMGAQMAKVVEERAREFDLKKTLNH
jgi:transcriptional regulator